MSLGKKKDRVSIFSRLRQWLMSYFRILIVDSYRICLYLSSAQRRKIMMGSIGNFLKALYQRIISEGVLRESASLSYVTILGFIPFITFIVMIAPDLPFLNLKEKISEVVATNFIPGSAKAVMDMINDMIARRMGLNIMVFVILLISSYSLFNNIRKTFDRILSTQLAESQDILTQFIKFFGTLVFGLVIMVLLFSSSSMPIISRILKLPIFTWLGYIVPFVLQFLALLFLYMLMPSIKIRRSSLFRGVFCTTVIWVLVKSGFDSYIYNLTSYQAVYGVIAALPIFLFWIYVNWVIILGGIVLISVIDSQDRRGCLKKCLPR
ncbi:MAG TPA: YihY family inner membrane protein [Candidatus Cloacimonadota bacterium]|nr:YihY family inner membrane protein [Candidatus Cloacimonadota bacterium]